MSDVPHFALPFRFASPQVAVTEQDSLEEISDCVVATLLCPEGFRVELPAFGWPDPTFGPGVDPRELRETIDTWEPRAQSTLSAHWDTDDELVQHVQVLLQLRTEG